MAAGWLLGRLVGCARAARDGRGGQPAQLAGSQQLVGSSSRTNKESRHQLALLWSTSQEGASHMHGHRMTAVLLLPGGRPASLDCLPPLPRHYY